MKFYDFGRSLYTQTVNFHRVGPATPIIELVLKAYNNSMPLIMREDTEYTISFATAKEVAIRFLSEKDVLEEFHKGGIKNIDEFKTAGLLTYWICRLKPVIILDDDPDNQEKFANEYLAITAAIGIYYHFYNELPDLSQRLIDNLKYTLRYRMITGRMLSLIYEFFVIGYQRGKEQA